MSLRTAGPLDRAWDDRSVQAYLSSFGLGTTPTHLVRLAGAGAPTGVIANAIDGEPADVRSARVGAELRALATLGLDPFPIDLRDYFDGQRPVLAGELRRCRAVWLRGGNVFLLRHALAASGADELITDLVANHRLVYAGYSAGPCVLGPALGGLEDVDDATEVARVYGSEPTWSGLGLLDYRVIPHVDSPTDPESAALDALVQRYEATGVRHITLRDGEALVINGESSEIVGEPATVDELAY